MKSISQKNFDKQITEKYVYDFILAEDGLYFIEIIASAKSWWQNLRSFRSFLNGDNLALVLDRLEITTSASNETNARAAWHGNELKGFLKTALIAIHLKKGKHVLYLTPDQSPYLKSITVKQVEEANILTYTPSDKMAQKGDGRPWLSFVLVNLEVNDITISAKADKRGRDDDDLKLIIDGEIQKNHPPAGGKKSHQDWYWCGKILGGKSLEFKKSVNFIGGLHTIDLWADEMPFLDRIELALAGGIKEIIIQPYLYRGSNDQEDYNRYDGLIKEAVDYWNEEFIKDADPVQEVLDYNLVKAMIFQESRVGYDKKNNGEINVMQVGNDGDASLDVLNGIGKKAEYELRDGRLWKLNYEGKAKVEKSSDSIHWGVRWLYHKVQYVGSDGKRHWNSWREAVKGYGPPNEKYSNNVWDIYLKGIDKRSKPPLKLWFIFIPILLSLLTAVYWIYDNQGRIYISYHEAKPGSWLCDNGESWVDVAMLDGFMLKKTRINKVQELKEVCHGLIKGSLKYSYRDIDNDSRYEIVLDGKWHNDSQVEYYLKVKNDRLAIIPIDASIFSGGPECLVDEVVYFTWPDERGKYTFATEAIVGYMSGPNKIFRDLYHFNDKGEIELYRRETEELTGNVSKIGKITEMPL